MVVIFIDKNTNAHVYSPQPQQHQVPQTYGGYPTAHATRPHYSASHSASHGPHHHHHSHGGHGAHGAHGGHRYLLAERYKTKTCRNYMMTGTCPYQHRCMFAHGQHELRTTDMNVRDGLMTEEAIRSFQRAMTAYNRGELAQMEAAQMAGHGYPAYGGNGSFSGSHHNSGSSSVHSRSSGSSTPDATATNAAVVTEAPSAQSEPQQAQAQAQPCQCDDCRALYATHNPYYSAVPPAGNLGRALNPYSSAAMLKQEIPNLEYSN